MKVYISGPMSGIEDFNRSAFYEAERKLKEAGYSVFNPAWLDVDDTWTDDELLYIDLAALHKCDAIYQLPGWKNSHGAMTEYLYAIEHKHKFIYLEARDDTYKQNTVPGIPEKICPVCGKIFIPAGLHSYKTASIPHRLVCSWTCMLKNEREYEAECERKASQRKKEIDYGQ